MIALRITALVLATTGVVCGVAAAQEEAKEAPVGLYKLKNRSSFTASEQSRPPFWPVGHVKKARGGSDVVVDSNPRPNLSSEMFNVTSIVLGNPSLAIINGRAYGEGEFLRQARDSRGKAPNERSRIRVARIVDGMVTLQSVDGQLINVPLRRPELNERRVDEEAELLLNDR